MDKSILKAAGIDYDDGVKRFMSNEALYEKMLVKFLDDTSLSDARNALADNDGDKLFMSVHSLKGISGNLSLTSVYDCSSKIVALIRSKDCAAIPNAMEELVRLYDSTVKAIAAAR